MATRDPISNAARDDLLNLSVDVGRLCTEVATVDALGQDIGALHARLYDEKGQNSVLSNFSRCDW